MQILVNGYNKCVQILFNPALKSIKTHSHTYIHTIIVQEQTIQHANFTYISPKKKKRFFVVTVKNHYTNKLQQHLFVVVVLWPLLLPLLTILTKCCLKHFNIETQCRCCYCVYCYWVVGCGIVLCATIHRQLQSSLTNQPTNQLKLQKYKMNKKKRIDIKKVFRKYNVQLCGIRN